MSPMYATSSTFAGSHPLNVQIRVHHLNNDENLESVLFRVQKGWTIHFKVGPGLLGKKLNIFTNYPTVAGTGFDRRKYYELVWKSDSHNKEDDTALYCEIIYEISGSYHYFFVEEGSVLDEPLGSGYILVEPKLTYGANDEIVPLNSLICQTYLAKCLGPFPEWEGRLQVAKETAYNMVHITPIQELGKSLSSYSLRNQLKLNPMFNTPGKTYNFQDVANLVTKMRKEWKVLSITDIVLNHTANESDWLIENPEATYNLQNSPHLKPAYLLDRALWHLTIETALGKWDVCDIPTVITEERHLEGVKNVLRGIFLSQLKIPELFMVNVDALVKEFEDIAGVVTSAVELPEPSVKEEEESLTIIQDPNYGRFSSTVDWKLAVQIYARNGEHSSYDNCQAFRQKLHELNNEIQSVINQHLDAAIENVIKAIRYERLNPHGPCYKEISKDCPLVAPYFYQIKEGTTLDEDMKLMNTDEAKFIMAHNGWVMGDNPLKNFAEPGSDVYIRRELIAWGDSVKLRYGNQPMDSPFLWEHMTKYVQEMARVFHGLRLDNCHSTPIHVAEYLIDKAREVRPDLYVIAELFTASEAIDNVFVNRLGITSLIREAMSAPDAHEEGRLVYRYGGKVVGAFVHPFVTPLTMNIAHAMFLDLTHDNKCPILQRSVYDLLPSAGLVSMACCATGSTRGYDELVPHQIDVVTENRKYSTWTDDEKPKAGFINSQSGIIAGKRALNKLHQELGAEGYSQVYVNQKGTHSIAVTRHCPSTHQSVVLVACTAFSPPANLNEHVWMDSEVISGVIDEIIFEARLKVKKSSDHKKDDVFINGLSNYVLEIRENFKLHESEMAKLGLHMYGKDSVDFNNFPQGAIIAFRVSLSSSARSSIIKLRTSVSQFGYRMRSYSGQTIKYRGKSFESVISNLTLADLNMIFFRCDSEEKDERHDDGTYNVPNYGPFVYCGLQGIMSELMIIHLCDDLGHPLCDNLRKGFWLPDYIVNRLLNYPPTRDLGEWFQGVFQNLTQVPDYLVPLYFDSVLTGAYSTLLTIAWKKMSDFVNDGSAFVKALAMGSIALCGAIHSAPLPELSPSLKEPFPPKEMGPDGVSRQCCVTLSAGLPHFSTGYMRNWGRDTFISLRGLLLIPGRYQEARYIILAFAGCLRHGLIPNLLNQGTCARFNCRDAVWWWLQSIQDYVKMVENGSDILTDQVSRLFPTDESEPQGPGKYDQPLCDTIQEAVQKHFQGLRFRERNAGHQIDEHMRDNGFNIEIGVHKDTGFVFGGNRDNCGTWMDKMGSSDKAGNRGMPATPRDGSAIELVGLSASALRWLSKMSDKGLYPYNGVECVLTKGKQSKTVTMTFKEWADLICANFEKHFWVDIEAIPTDSEYINRRGIYKDTYGASTPWTDFQLRPNLCIAMVVAPELFNPQRAWMALKMVQKSLLSCLGMKTLDPSDWQYNGYYDNSDDSDVKTKAKGFNYHQGPEWLWPVGYFLRAKMIFTTLASKNLESTLSFVKEVMSHHFKEIQRNKWKGLPELTNKDGEFCRDSCPIQAWSHACLLEVLYDIDNLAS